MPAADIEKLRQLIARLRSPGGCPWDREQTLDNVRAYLVEEAHETAAAIDSGDRKELLAELGDLIFQTVFVASLAEDEGAFDLADAIDGVHAKMIERHPHVFGDESFEDAAAVHRAWELRKLSRGKDSADPSSIPSVLKGVPKSLPALTAALRMSQKASGVGFDWRQPSDVLEKVREEVSEVEEAAASGDLRRQKEELGDLLFAIVNLARHLKIDPESALAAANLKFRSRFGKVEKVLASRGRDVAGAAFEEMEDTWQEVKRGERGDAGGTDPV